MDSRSCSPIDLDSSSILTPAMEEVIRVREVRKSMEQSGHFFTPICSPMTTADPTPINRFQSPTLTPRNMDLYMTMDCTPEEEEPRRKKSNGSGKGFVTPSSPSKRVLRNRLHESVILDDSTSSSVNSSTAGETSSSTTPDNQRRVVHRRDLILKIWVIHLKRVDYFCFFFRQVQSGRHGFCVYANVTRRFKSTISSTETLFAEVSCSISSKHSGETPPSSAANYRP